MYRSLQAGRAAAAVLVVLFHLGGAFAASHYFALPAFAIPFSFGDAGVPFFFVLSGFIIATVHRRDLGRPERLGRYAFRRMVRIFPPYWLVFVAVFLGVSLSPDLRGILPTDPLLIAKALLLVPLDKTVVSGTGAPVIVVAWTLQYEVVFYILFGALIVRRWLGLAAAGGLLGAYLWGQGREGVSFPVSFIAEDCMLVFFIGVAVAALHSSPLRIDRPRLLAMVGGMLFSVVALGHVFGVDLVGDREVLAYGLASGVMVLGLVRAEDRGIVVGGHPVLQEIGNAYALYLLHFPLISLLSKVAMFLGLGSAGLAGALAGYVAILLSCIAAAVTFHRWIEVPLLRRLNEGRGVHG